MTLLIENPVPVLFVGVVAAAILAIFFFNTGRAVFLLAIGGVILLTLIGVAVEHFVVTDREEVETALYAMADAMEANDKNAGIALISPSNTQSLTQAKWAFDRFNVQQANVSNLNIVVNNLTSPPSATAKFDAFIYVRDRKSDMPGGENFLVTLDYRKEGDRWLITHHDAKIAPFGAEHNDR